MNAEILRKIDEKLGLHFNNNIFSEQDEKYILFNINNKQHLYEHFNKLGKYTIDKKISELKHKHNNNYVKAFKHKLKTSHNGAMFKERQLLHIKIKDLQSDDRIREISWI